MNIHLFSQTYKFLCSYCNYLVKTEGPWPYCREGKQKGRPYENLSEACLGPVHGLMAIVYCPNCDKKKEYPIVGYERPLPNLSGIWWTDIPRKTKLTCHRCEKPVYLISLREK